MSDETDTAGVSSERRRATIYRSGPALYALLGIAIFFTLDAAATFFIPVVAAFLIYLLLSPVSRLLVGFGTPRVIAAALIVPATVACLGSGVYALGGPAAEWFARTPTLGDELKSRLGTLLEPVQKVKEATENVEKATSVKSDRPVREVTVRKSSLSDRLFEGAGNFGAGLAVVIILTFFFLAYFERFSRRVLHAIQGRDGAREIERRVQRIQSDVSVYLGTIAAINLCLGVAIGIALYLLGFPSAALWGAIAALANFVPYFGPIAAIVITAVVGLISVPQIEFAVAGALIHAGLNFIEGQFITPLVLGRRLTVNPIVIFVWVAFWGWLWGIAGAIMAVPLLLLIRIVSGHIPMLSGLAVVLGNGEREHALAADGPDSNMESNAESNEDSNEESNAAGALPLADGTARADRA